MVSVAAGSSVAPGSWMLVHIEGAAGSLGDPALDARALAHARRLLDAGPSGASEEAMLSDEGSWATLRFEPLASASAAWLESWRRAARELVRRPGAGEREAAE